MGCRPLRHLSMGTPAHMYTGISWNACRHVTPMPALPLSHVQDGEPHQCSNPELADATELGDWVPAETKPKQGGRKAGAVHKSMLLETGKPAVAGGGWGQPG